MQWGSASFKNTSKMSWFPWSLKHGIPIVAHCLDISPKPEMRSNPDLKGHGRVVSSIDRHSIELFTSRFSHTGEKFENKQINKKHWTVLTWRDKQCKLCQLQVQKIWLKNPVGSLSEAEGFVLFCFVFFCLLIFACLSWLVSIYQLTDLRTSTEIQLSKGIDILAGNT